MRFDIDVAQHQLSWPELLERVRWCENVGFECAWVFDHFKALDGDPTGPCLEGWTLLAALGAATERIRLGTLVTGITYRHPSILATEAVTVDHVSNGRVECAIGGAWFEDEHRELGIDFPVRRRADLAAGGGRAGPAAADDDRRRVVRRAVLPAGPRRATGRGRSSSRTRPSGSAARETGCFASPDGTRTRGTAWASPSSSPASPGCWQRRPRPPAATQPRSFGPRHCRSPIPGKTSAGPSTRWPKPGRAA